MRAALPCIARFLASTLATLLLAPVVSGQFAAPQPVSLGIGTPPDNVTGVVRGDLNGDLLGDVVGTDNASPGKVGLALRTAGGAYTTQTPVVDPAGSPNGAFLPQLADFDLDGNLDLVHAGTTPFAGATDTAVFVLRGVLSGANYTFVPTVIVTLLPLPSTVTGLRTTDYDGDGLQDILVTISSSTPANNRVGLIRNLGGFTFGPLTSSTTATGPSQIDVCVDYNQDGRKDSVICRAIPGGLSFVDVYQGVGPPQFFPSSPTISLALPPGFEPVDVHWLDCDQRNDYDLAVCGRGSNPGILLIRNLGAPPFFNSPTGTLPFALNGVPAAIRRMEFDFDGVEDLTVFEIGSGPTSLRPTTFEVLGIDDCALTSLLVTSVGTYETAALELPIAEPQTAGDQDHDGKSDLVTLNHVAGAADEVLVYQNITPTSFAIAPTHPLLGQSVAFTFFIQTSPTLAGRQFWVAFSLMGTEPGLTINGGLLFHLNPPFLPLFIPGILDGTGNGSFTAPPILIPPAPRLFSTQLAAAFVVQGPVPGAGFAFTSNPAVVTIP
ncbi:MAG: FG-GAP-like repeat-containing protein [Planctomycetota bacterium]